MEQAGGEGERGGVKLNGVESWGAKVMMLIIVKQRISFRVIWQI